MVVYNIANIKKYDEIHTKYIQNIYNTYKMAAQEKPNLATYPSGAVKRNFRETVEKQ